MSKAGEMMKKIKEYLARIKLKKQVGEALELGKAPLIGVRITLSDGASVQTSGKVINLLCEALGEDTAVEWHSKYMNEFDELTKKCYSELEDLVKKAKEAKK